MTDEILTGIVQECFDHIINQKIEYDKNQKNPIHERRGMVLTNWKYDNNRDILHNIKVKESCPYELARELIYVPANNEIKKMEYQITQSLASKGIERKENTFVVMISGSSWSFVEPDGNIPYYTVNIGQMKNMKVRRP